MSRFFLFVISPAWLLFLAPLPPRPLTSTLPAPATLEPLRLLGCFAAVAAPKRTNEQNPPKRIIRRSGWSASREYELGKTKVVSGRVTADKFSKNLVISPEIAAPLADLDKVRVVTHTHTFFVFFYFPLFYFICFLFVFSFVFQRSRLEDTP